MDNIVYKNPLTLFYDFFSHWVIKLILFCMLGIGFFSFAEELEEEEPTGPFTHSVVEALAILPTTDTTGLNLAVPIQYALVTLFQQTKAYTAQPMSFIFESFTEKAMNDAAEALGVDKLAFAYVQPSQVSLFFIDILHSSKQFIVASQPMTDPTGQNLLTPQVLEYNLRLAFNQLLILIKDEKFQFLPGEEDPELLAFEKQEETKKRIAYTRQLFRELATIQNKHYYLGASIGMARFSAKDSSASSVDFGGYFGARLSKSLSAELSLDLFSYSFLQLSALYALPIPDKYVSLNTTLGMGMILGTVSENRGFTSTNFNTGQIFFGPGINFNVPLMGAHVRGEIKLLLGGGSVFVGTYGVNFNVNI